MHIDIDLGEVEPTQPDFPEHLQGRNREEVIIPFKVENIELVVRHPNESSYDSITEPRDLLDRGLL